MSSWRNTILIGVTFSLLIVQTTTPSWAASSQASPKPTVPPIDNLFPNGTPLPTPSDEVLKNNIKQLVDKATEKMQDTRSEDEKRKKAFVGQVEKVTSESLFIKTDSGQEAVRLVAQRTYILDTTRQTTIQAQEIELGSWVIVMGMLNEDNVVEARRILVSASPLLSPKRQAFFGNVVKASSVSIAIKQADTTIKTFKISTKTRLANKAGDKVSVGTFKPNLGIVLLTMDDSASSSAYLLRATTELPGTP